MLQISGRVWVGPGVTESGVVVTGVGDSVTCAVVSTTVGTGVAAGAAGWEQPATNARIRQAERMHALTRYFFITTDFPGGYFRFVSPGTPVKPLRNDYLATG
jgi:hypothetical protein